MSTQNPFGANPFDPAQRPDPTDAGPPPTHDEVNVLATLSVVFAFVFAPAGALLGQIGLWQIAGSGERGRERALVGVTLSYAFITAAVVALVVSVAMRGDDTAAQTTSAPTSATVATAAPTPPTAAGTRPSAAPAPTVSVAGLDGLLPTLEEIQSIPGLPDRMELKGTDNALFDRFRGGITITPADCYTAFGEADSHGYDTSALSGIRINGYRALVREAGSDQSVAAYGDAAAARSGVQRLLATWRSCGGSSFSYSDPDGGGRVATWAVSVPADVGNGISTVTANATRVMTGQISRAVAVKANVVVDVAVGARPGPDRTSVAVAVVNLILGKIPGPR